MRRRSGFALAATSTGRQHTGRVGASRYQRAFAIFRDATRLEYHYDNRLVCFIATHSNRIATTHIITILSILAEFEEYARRRSVMFALLDRSRTFALLLPMLLAGFGPVLKGVRNRYIYVDELGNMLLCLIRHTLASAVALLAKSAACNARVAITSPTTRQKCTVQPVLCTAHTDSGTFGITKDSANDTHK
jgi:hypothetical protein